jgi:hypothetical protein
MPSRWVRGMAPAPFTRLQNAFAKKVENLAATAAV